MRAESAGFVRLAVDADGVSHFVDDEMPMAPRDFAPPAAPLEVTEPADAAAVVFWRAPAGWDGRQHPSPARQWAIVCEGAIEIEAGSGEKRCFEPGDRLLLEDLSGAGHTTRVGGAPAVGMFVQVPEKRGGGGRFGGRI